VTILVFTIPRECESRAEEGTKEQKMSRFSNARGDGRSDVRVTFLPFGIDTPAPDPRLRGKGKRREGEFHYVMVACEDASPGSTRFDTEITAGGQRSRFVV
jgi:hypothetical protein